MGVSVAFEVVLVDINDMIDVISKLEHINYRFANREICCLVPSGNRTCLKEGIVIGSLLSNILRIEWRKYKKGKYEDMKLFMINDNMLKFDEKHKCLFFPDLEKNQGMQWPKRRTGC